MTTMKKWIALLLTLTLLLSFTACMGGTDKPDATDPDDTGASAELTENGSAADPSAAFDVGSLNWVDGELDCYGYKEQGEDCYLSFRRPESFTAVEHDNSGEQYRGYYFHPENPDATANESPYGIYAYFMQGGYGGHKAGFEESLPNGFAERELGGRTVLFGELPADENTGSHTFVYYVGYDEEDWARIWILLVEPEADGAFRQTFEQSLRFTKE